MQKILLTIKELRDTPMSVTTKSIIAKKAGIPIEHLVINKDYWADGSSLDMMYEVSDSRDATNQEEK